VPQSRYHAHYSLYGESFKLLMNSLNRDLAIMFADVSGSSALYKRLGNLRAKRSVDTTIAMMSEITQEHGGTVVKTLGDEIMARFETSCQACAAAIAIQRAGRHTSNSLRIGLAFGPALVETDDVFGETVNDAACVAHIARANQVVLTQSVADQLTGELHQRCQEFDRIAVKGDTEHSLIYRLQWETLTQDHSATKVMSIDEISGHLSGFQLTLEVAQQTLTIHPEQTPYVIGRDPQNAHLHIESGRASRDHCHIIFRRGKFVLVDHSTNGTYVNGPEQPEIYLRREEFPLFGTGTIAIGQSAQAQDPWLIHYRA